MVSSPSVRHPGEFRWETRLLAVVTLTLTVFGIVNCYSTAAYMTTWFNEASQQVSGAVVAIVLVLCAVFVPVAFLGGIAGELYRQFAVTIGVGLMVGSFRQTVVRWLDTSLRNDVFVSAPGVNGGRLDAPLPAPHDDGLGLRLMIAAAVAEAHGGTLRAQARDGGGVRFECELPVA